MPTEEIKQKNEITDSIKKVQIFLGVLYLLMIAIGMLFSYKKYAEFGINVFEYADIFDFFIAPFTDPKIIIFSFLTFLLIFGLIGLDSLAKKKSEKFYSMYHFGFNKKPWFKTYMKITYITIFLLYMSLASDYYAKKSVKQINSAIPISLIYSSGEASVGKQIGKTKEVVFLLVDNEVSAIPITSLVKEIKISKLTKEK